MNTNDQPWLNPELRARHLPIPSFEDQISELRALSVAVLSYPANQLAKILHPTELDCSLLCWKATLNRHGS